MPDFTFQKSRCYASASDHQNLLNALPRANEPHLITTGAGGTERIVCRFADDRIWVQGPQENNKLAWVKMSSSATVPSAQLSGLRPAPTLRLRVPLGVPSDLIAIDPGVIEQYQALSEMTFGPEGTTLYDESVAADNMQRQDTARADTPRANPARPATTAPATPHADPPAAVAVPSQPVWRGLQIPSVVTPQVLQAIALSWPVGAAGDLASPDGQVRRFVRHQAHITATDVMSNTIVLARLG